MNHLIIGLGGTGGRVIRSFRKTLFNLRSATPDVNIEYLYVDSDDGSMALDDPDWKVNGRKRSTGPPEPMQDQKRRSPQVSGQPVQLPRVETLAGHRG